MGKQEFISLANNMGFSTATVGNTVEAWIYHYALRSEPSLLRNLERCAPLDGMWYVETKTRQIGTSIEMRMIFVKREEVAEELGRKVYSLLQRIEVLEARVMKLEKN